MRILALTLLVALSGCLSTGIEDMVATPADLPAGYAYWPVEESEWLRTTFNMTSNPGRADTGALVDGGVVPSSAYVAALHNNGSSGDNVVVTVAMRFGSSADRQQWIDGMREDCDDVTFLLERDGIVTWVSGFDDAAGPGIQAAAAALQDRAGAIDLCDPPRAWF